MILDLKVVIFYTKILSNFDRMHHFREKLISGSSFRIKVNRYKKDYLLEKYVWYIKLFIHKKWNLNSTFTYNIYWKLNAYKQKYFIVRSEVYQTFNINNGVTHFVVELNKDSGSSKVSFFSAFRCDLTVLLLTVWRISHSAHLW